MRINTWVAALIASIMIYVATEMVIYAITGSGILVK